MVRKFEQPLREDLIRVYNIEHVMEKLNREKISSSLKDLGPGIIQSNETQRNKKTLFHTAQNKSGKALAIGLGDDEELNKLLKCIKGC